MSYQTTWLWKAGSWTCRVRRRPGAWTSRLGDADWEFSTAHGLQAVPGHAERGTGGTGCFNTKLLALVVHGGQLAQTLVGGAECMGGQALSFPPLQHIAKPHLHGYDMLVLCVYCLCTCMTESWAHSDLSMFSATTSGSACRSP